MAKLSTDVEAIRADSMYADIISADPLMGAAKMVNVLNFLKYDNFIRYDWRMLGS
ncbi:MAG: hypothetical protein DHS20C08_16020 [Rhodomicrobium sp.]|nr:MAG: hypothetical protein DHS20C08_16020 [Rhodomicrobium sp.]